MRIFSIAIAAGLLLSLVGCDEIESIIGTPESEESTTSDQPPANVNLPPVPQLELLDVPNQYEDGARSVVGALRAGDELLGENVRVRGILAEVYECDVEPTADADGADNDGAEQDADAADNPMRAGCLRPHLYISDNERSPRRLLATGYDHRLYEPQLRPGLRYTFVGSMREGAAGFTTSDGLLLIDSIEGNGVTEEPPAEDGDADTE